MDLKNPLARYKFKLYTLLEDDPKMSIFILSTIVLSILCMMLRTMQELHWVSPDTWAWIEIATTVIFTAEYVGRLSVCNIYGTRVWAWIVSPMNVCDALAIAPFYIELIIKLSGMRGNASLQALRALRAIRLVRLFRVFRLGKFSSGMRVMVEAIALSSQALTLLVFMLFIEVILFGAIVFYAETGYCPGLNSGAYTELYHEICAKGGWQGSGFDQNGVLCCDSYGHPLDFYSILDACWWAIVTMTTVGYGDKYPKTAIGKVVGSACMLFGILLIALPTAIVGQKFQEVYRANEERTANAAPPSRSLNLAGLVAKARMTRTARDKLSAKLATKTSAGGGWTSRSQPDAGERRRMMRRSDSDAVSALGDATGGSNPTRQRQPVEVSGDTGSSMSGSPGRILYLLEQLSESKKKLDGLQAREDELRLELQSNLSTMSDAMQTG
jgi:hypothetical protein